MLWIHLGPPVGKSVIRRRRNRDGLLPDRPSGRGGAPSTIIMFPVPVGWSHRCTSPQDLPARWMVRPINTHPGLNTSPKRHIQPGKPVLPPSKSAVGHQVLAGRRFHGHNRHKPKRRDGAARRPSPKRFHRSSAFSRSVPWITRARRGAGAHLRLESTPPSALPVAVRLQNPHSANCKARPFPKPTRQIHCVVCHTQASITARLSACELPMLLKSREAATARNNRRFIKRSPAAG